MKTNNSKNKAKAFLGAAFMLLIALIFTACPQKVKPKAEEAPAAPPEYTPVAYDKLAEYLANTASATKINKIEVTGLKAEHLKGTYPNPSPLGQILKANSTKKVALKLPKTVEGLTDMSSCFQQCANLVQVRNIPDGVTNMNNCFTECSSLTEAPAIPPSVQDITQCFYKCSSLVKAPVIHARVTSMQNCFYDCTSLKEPPAIPDTVTDMKQCFMNCGSLTKAPSVIPDGVTDMIQCFAGCGSLTKAPAIPQNVVSMNRCFEGCGSLIEAPEIPATVTSIWACFDGCGKIKGVVLKCNYKDGSFYDLFQNCASLEDGGIKVPQGQLQTYKDNANKMVTTEEKFGVSVAYSELSAFLAGTNSSAADVNYIEVTGLTKADLEENGGDSCKLGNKLKAYPSKKVALELPKEVEGLTDISFRTCTSLVSVRNIPKSVRSMENCFRGCTSLKYVSEVPSGIMHMKECFSGCTALTKAPTIPSGITTMQECFSGCTALTSVTLKCDYDPRNRSLKDAFQDCTALGEKSIKVPQAYYGNYTTAAALNTMAVPGANEAEQRKKFEGVAELNP